MLEPLHFPHRCSRMRCAFWLLCGSCDDGESVMPPLCSVGFDFRYWGAGDGRSDTHAISRMSLMAAKLSE